MYSVNVRYSTIKAFLKKYEIIKGSGKLSGVYLFCASENDILPEQTITACINDGCITVDREIGLIM